MQVNFDVPEDVVRQFAAEPGGITRAALEALAIESVRSGRLTSHQARRMLGIPSRRQMDGFLKAHGVLLPITLNEVARDCEAALAFSNADPETLGVLTDARRMRRAGRQTRSRAAGDFAKRGGAGR